MKQMSMTLRCLYSAEEISEAVHRSAAEVQRLFPPGEPVTVLILLNGALWFAADLLRLLPDNYEAESVRVASYGNARETSGQLTWKSPLPECCGKRVLVLDDVLDSGITLHAVVTALHEAGALQVCTAVAVSKDATRCRRIPFEADVAALRAPASYLVGYGMDAAGRYRNLPAVYELSEK